MVRRQAVQDVGGFDEALWLAEDVDLVWRLTMAGWTIRYERPAGCITSTGSAWGPCWPAGPPTATRPAPCPPPPWQGGARAAVGLERARLEPAAAGAPVVGVAVAVATSARMARGLRGLDHPGREAARLAGLGHLQAGRLLRPR